MPEKLPPSEAPDLGDVVARLERLERALAHLRAGLDDLRSHLRAEVRTRRVTVVEHDGFERLVLDSAGHFGHLTVQARGSTRGSVAVEVFAADPVDGDAAHVGLALIIEGDVVAAVDVQQGRPAMVWAPGESGDG